MPPPSPPPPLPPPAPPSLPPAPPGALCADLKNDDGSDFAVSGGFYTCARIEMHAPELCARTKGTGEAETLPSEMCCFCGGGAIA